MNHAEQLKAMLQDVINGKEEQAAITLHDYFVAKTQEVSGLVTQSNAADDSTDFADSDFDETVE
jgi:hypothetical protein